MMQPSPKNEKLCELGQKLHSFALFRNLLRQPVLHTLLKLLDVLCADLPPAVAPQAVDAYCEFVEALYNQQGDLGAYLLRSVLENETPVLHAYAKGGQPPHYMQKTLEQELTVLTQLSCLSPAELEAGAAAAFPLPLWANTPQDFVAQYQARLAEVHSKGYGVFAAYHMFTLNETGGLLPVKNPDPQRLAELTGYQREREQILVNTRALLRGLPANNILLYGDAGTGKSSTVKALANNFCEKGLRLVEVRKNQLYLIPALMDRLAENPLKFILFIDDLSFPADDKDFTALKAILEGNVSARPRNIVVYATSNRRHMLKERFSDRQGDDLHVGDTLEEEASLSARFGLTITFLKPDKELYARIVHSLAEEYGLVMPKEELVKMAEAHAIRYGGRSPRTARQFIEYQKAAQQEKAPKDE